MNKHGFDLSNMTVEELKDLKDAIECAIIDRAEKDYLAKLKTFKDALKVLATDYPCKDAFDTGNECWTFEELYDVMWGYKTFFEEPLDK